MTIYEGLFLLNAPKANRDWDQVFAHVCDILKKHGAELIRSEKWGERKLAYTVQREKRGSYLLTYFHADGDAVTRIYRECELSDVIMRALILAVPVVPEPKAPPATIEEVTARARAARQAAAMGGGGGGRSRGPVDVPDEATSTYVEEKK